MKVFKRRQVVVLSLVLVVLVAGYLQYSYKKSSISADNKDSSKQGEAVYVDNNEQSSNDQKDKKDSTKATSASKQANDFFAQAKIDKANSRSKDTSSLKGITEDTKASKESKAKAYEQMTKIVGNSDKEMRIEALIREKGFSDAVALFGDDGSLDIVVKAPELSSMQVAQITDIASRQGNVQISKLHVRNIY